MCLPLVSWHAKLEAPGHEKSLLCQDTPVLMREKLLFPRTQSNIDNLHYFNKTKELRLHTQP